MDTDGEGLDFGQPFQVWRWLRDRCDWPMREKMAYWCLYSRRGKDGSAPYPGLRRLALDMGSNRNSALTAVRTLKELGALQIEARTMAGRGDRDTHRYELRPPWGAEQTVNRKPRGRFALKESGVTARCDEVAMKHGNVAIKHGKGSHEMTQGLAIKHGHNEPKERAKRTSQVASGPSATERTVKEAAPFTQEAQELVSFLHEWLKGQGLPGLSGAPWAAAVNIARKALAGGQAGPPIPAEDANAALRWATDQTRWRERLKGDGMKVLRAIWAAWTEKDAGSTAKSRRGYHDHTAEGASFDDGWRRATKGETA